MNTFILSTDAERKMDVTVQAVPYVQSLWRRSHAMCGRGTAATMSFFVRIGHAYMETRRLKAESVIRQYKHLHEQLLRDTYGLPAEPLHGARRGDDANCAGAREMPINAWGASAAPRP